MVTSYVQLLARRYKSQLDADAEVETTKMTDSLPLIHTGEDHVGWMRAEVWQGTHDILLEQGLLDEPVDLAEVYTMEFLQKVYGVGVWTKWPFGPYLVVCQIANHYM